MPDEMSDSVKPWTIRGIPPEERNAASEAAKRADMNLGEWLRRAIRTEIQQEMQANRAPVPVGLLVSDSRTMLADVERIAASLQGLAEAGLPVSKSHAAAVTRALVAQLPAAPGRRKSDKAAAVSDKEVTDAVIG